MVISAQQNASLLKIQNVCKYFSGLKAVDDVSFDLRVGEILGLIGPNGSGKTTLINVITGLLPATSGQLYIDQKEITRLPAHDVARVGIARTFQTIRLFRELTVLENVQVAGVSLGLTHGEAKDLALSLLQEVGLYDSADRLATELAYGNQRRLEIARALAMRPKFLLLDEPAAGLNQEEGEVLLSMLIKLPAEKNLGVLVVDHDMHLIMRLCDRLHVLNYGRTIADGTPDEVRKDKAVIQAYLGRSAKE